MSDQLLDALAGLALAGSVTIVTALYAGEDPPGTHLVSWQGSDVPAASLAGFAAAVGEVLALLTDGSSLLILGVLA